MYIKKFSFAALASAVVLAGSGAYAATACQSASIADFDNSQGNAATSLSTWLSGTDGGSDDFFTISNGTSMCEFSELGGAANDKETNVGDFESDPRFSDTKSKMKLLSDGEVVDPLEGMPEVDKWGIKGLRTLMNNYPDYHAMVVGMDPTSLGLDMGSQE